MEPTQQNSAPVTPTTPPVAPAPGPNMPSGKAGKGGWGTVLAIIIVLALIVIGAFYVWGKRIAEQGGATPQEQQQIDELNAQSTSTDASDIEADLASQSNADFDSAIDSSFTSADSAFDGN